MLIPVKRVYSKMYICSLSQSVVQTAALRKFEFVGKHETASQGNISQD